MNVLLRCEMVDGFAKWRHLVDLKPETLCFQFGLDPHRVVFDLSKSSYEVKPTDGSRLRNGRTIGGFIRDRGTGEVVGKLIFATEGEKFADRDPNDRQDFERL